MSEKTNGKDVLSQRFWENVSITLVKKKKSFVWLENAAEITKNLSRSSKANQHRVRLSLALKVAKILDIDLGKLLYCEYRLEEI